MTSTVMLDITMEVSVSKSFPIKGKTQATLGHPWAPLGTICTLGIADIFWLKLWETLLFWDFGLNSLKYRITCWTNV